MRGGIPAYYAFSLKRVPPIGYCLWKYTMPLVL